VRVPGGALFVLGDDRLNSNDSRFGLGFVPVDKVVGRAFAIVWPPSRVGWIH
jgi:signal peptidase I